MLETMSCNDRLVQSCVSLGREVEIATYSYMRSILIKKCTKTAAHSRLFIQNDVDTQAHKEGPSCCRANELCGRLVRDSNGYRAKVLTIPILCTVRMSIPPIIPAPATMIQFTKIWPTRSPLLKMTARIPMERPPTIPRSAIPVVLPKSKNPIEAPIVKKPITMPKRARSGIPSLDSVLMNAAQPSNEQVTNRSVNSHTKGVA